MCGRSSTARTVFSPAMALQLLAALSVCNAAAADQWSPWKVQYGIGACTMFTYVTPPVGERFKDEEGGSFGPNPSYDPALEYLVVGFSRVAFKEYVPTTEAGPIGEVGDRLAYFAFPNDRANDASLFRSEERVRPVETVVVGGIETRLAQEKEFLYNHYFFVGEPESDVLWEALYAGDTIEITAQREGVDDVKIVGPGVGLHDFRLSAVQLEACSSELLRDPEFYREHLQESRSP